jgi:hypothetical protein
MIYRFELKDEDDSKRHQTAFFDMGYEWWGTANKFIDMHVKYLYLNSDDKGIMYSIELDPTPDEVECKLLHPKQLEFLKGILVLNSVSCIPDIIKNGFYKLEDAEYLNALLKGDKILTEL